MKKLVSALVLMIGLNAQAYDANYVHKFTCSGGLFFGVPLSSGLPVPYIPVDVNGTFCTVYPSTRLTAGSNSSCMNLRVENTGKPVSQCSRGN